MQVITSFKRFVSRGRGLGWIYLLGRISLIGSQSQPLHALSEESTAPAQPFDERLKADKPNDPPYVASIKEAFERASLAYVLGNEAEDSKRASVFPLVARPQQRIYLLDLYRRAGLLATYKEIAQQKPLVVNERFVKKNYLLEGPSSALHRRKAYHLLGTTPTAWEEVMLVLDLMTPTYDTAYLKNRQRVYRGLKANPSCQNQLRQIFKELAPSCDLLSSVLDPDCFLNQDQVYPKAVKIQYNLLSYVFHLVNSNRSFKKRTDRVYLWESNLYMLQLVCWIYVSCQFPAFIGLFSRVLEDELYRKIQFQLYISTVSDPFLGQIKRAYLDIPRDASDLLGTYAERYMALAHRRLTEKPIADPINNKEACKEAIIDQFKTYMREIGELFIGEGLIAYDGYKICSLIFQKSPQFRDWLRTDSAVPIDLRIELASKPNAGQGTVSLVPCMVSEETELREHIGSLDMPTDLTEALFGERAVVLYSNGKWRIHPSKYFFVLVFWDIWTQEARAKSYGDSLVTATVIACFIMSAVMASRSHLFAPLMRLLRLQKEKVAHLKLMENLGEVACLVDTFLRAGAHTLSLLDEEKNIGPLLLAYLRQTKQFLEGTHPDKRCQQLVQKILRQDWSALGWHYYLPGSRLELFLFKKEIKHVLAVLSFELGQVAHQLAVHDLIYPPAPSPSPPPPFVLPTYGENAPIFCDITDGWLVDFGKKQAVPNNLVFLPEEETLIITGGHGFGKTQALHMVQQIFYLGATIGVVPAKQASIGLPHALLLLKDPREVPSKGRSLFMQESYEIKEVLRLMESIPKSCLFTDDLFSSTDQKTAGLLFKRFMKEISDRSTESKQCMATNHTQIKAYVSSQPRTVSYQMLQQPSGKPSYRLKKGVAYNQTVASYYEKKRSQTIGPNAVLIQPKDPCTTNT